jgi:hypothetical protein
MGEMSKVVICCFVLMVVSISNATIWVGDGNDGKWTTAANWDAGVPDSSVMAVIGSGAGIITLDTAGQAASAVKIDSTLNIGIGGELTCSGPGSATVNFVVGTLGTEIGVLNLNGGSVTISAQVVSIADYGTGTLSMNGGIFDASAAWQFNVGRRSGSHGHIQLDAGLLKIGGIAMSADSTVDITGGTMVLVGDRRGGVNYYLGTDQITAYGNTDDSLVSVVYDTGTNLTTVTAIPEPASLVLLGISGTLLMMKRRW